MIGLNRFGNCFYYGSIGNIVGLGKVGWVKYVGKRKYCGWFFFIVLYG